jgi:hypothetical protein
MDGFCRFELAGSQTDSLFKVDPDIRVLATECSVMVERTSELGMTDVTALWMIV